MRKLSIFFFSTLAVFVLLFLGTETSLFAANDGSLGSTSTGDSDLSVPIPKLVRIASVPDFDFGSYDGTTDPATLNSNTCVWTNDTTGQYTVNAVGDGTANAFTVSDGTDVIPYAVYWNDATGTSGNVQLSTGVMSGTQTGANTSSQSCSGGLSSNLEVRIARSDILSSQAGTYTGVISITIAPVL